jgi:hypothetical protein
MERTTTAWLAVLWGLLCLEVGCGARSDASPGPASSASTAPSVTSSASSSATGTATPGSAAGARGCPREHARHTPRGKYRHLRTRAFVQAQGEPKHAGPDAVVPRGGKGTLRAKLAYGPLHKDLEDEDVRVFVRADDCTFRDLGAHRTDDDGWVSVELDGGSLGAPGAHAAEVVVEGDGSRAELTVWVIEKGTPAVVFDIDATLTTSDREVFAEVLKGRVPAMRADADRVVEAYCKAGHTPIYLTGRPYMLGPASRAWLEARGMCPGVVRTTTRVEASLPSESEVGAFKEAELRALRDAGLELRVAYGNATTDICAYARAGITPDKTFIVGPHGGLACTSLDGAAPTVGLGDAYTGHLPSLPTLVKRAP